MTAINLYIIGERIQQRRFELNLTQKEMARDLDISFHYLSKIEHGQANITVELLIRICQYLEVDLAYILTGSIFRNEIYGQNIPISLLNTFSGLPKTKQQMIYHILSLLKEI